MGTGFAQSSYIGLKNPPIIGASGVLFLFLFLFLPSISLAASITHSLTAPSALSSIGRPSLRHTNVHQTLTGEALSPDSIKIPAVSALFADVQATTTSARIVVVCFPRRFSNALWRAALIIFHQDSRSNRALRSCALITVKQATTSADVVVVCFERHSSNADR